MATDAFLQLSTAQAITATAVSTNTVDLGVARDIAPGRALYLLVQVDVTFTAAGAGTLEIQAISSAAAALTSPTVLGSSGAIAKTELTAGRRLIAVGIGSAPLLAAPNGQRYIGANYVVTTGPMTAGAVTATITDYLPPGASYYASGYTVA